MLFKTKMADMKTIWFKGKYIEPILDGTKTDTIRKGIIQIKPGAIIPAQNGPRKPFARLKILSCAPIDISDLPPERQAGVRSIYGDCSTLTKIKFSIL